jgi:hypothetical protein
MLGISPSSQFCAQSWNVLNSMGGLVGDPILAEF